MPLPSGVEIIHARFLYFVADLRVFLDGLSMQWLRGYGDFFLLLFPSLFSSPIIIGGKISESFEGKNKSIKSMNHK